MESGEGSEREQEEEIMIFKELKFIFETLADPAFSILGLKYKDPFSLINQNPSVEKNRDFSFVDRTNSRKWTGIVIHHSATVDGKTNDWEAIRKYHIKTNGWKDIGYNFGIEWDTDKFVYRVGRPLSMIGGHTKGFNMACIGICCVGNYDVALPKTEAWEMTKDLTKYLMKCYNISADNQHIIGHWESYDILKKPREKSCPGKSWDMNKFRGELT